MGKKILSIGILIFLFSKASPQNFIHQLIRKEKGVSKQFAAIPGNETVKFNAAKLNELLNLNNNASLVLMQTSYDQPGFIHYRYYQTYKGIPVENSMYIVHTKNGLLKSLGGTIVTDFDAMIDERSLPKISDKESINAAIKFVDAKLYAWQNNNIEQKIKQQTSNKHVSYKPSASLVWYDANESISSKDLRLCYKIDVYATMPLSRAYYYADAITGKILGKQDELFYADATGTAETAYSRIQTIHSDDNNGSYRLRDYSKGGGILTFHGEPLISGTDYFNTSSNWNLTGTDQAALDVHYGLSQAYLFYQTVFNRNSYDDRAATITAYVNTSNTDASFWDGSAVNFGKRSSGANGGTASIDIVAHELTHGVAQQTSGLNYSKEPGAINESLSDIFGKSVQFWSKPYDIDWRLGNEMNFILRDMSNPKAYHQPDTYQGVNWATDSYDNYGVHTNCGVGNFMFYLLVSGGTGTNDDGSNYSVKGIGITEAEAILYRSNAIYLTPTSQYADWRVACINAAADLFGATSNEVIQVENAWYAAGVGTSGYSAGCTAPTNLTISCVKKSSAILSWNKVPGSLGYNLQYKALNGTDYISVRNILVSSYKLTGLLPGSDYTCYVQTVCTDSTLGNYSKPDTFKTSGKTHTTYCATHGNSTYEYINKVVLGSINNTSGNNNGYCDFTSLTATLKTGSSETIRLVPGFTGAPYNEYWTVYVDYNKNKVFDADELVVSSSGTGTILKAFTVPADVKSCYTRMRIIMHYNGARTNACDTFNNGEVEDYRVHIKNTSGYNVADDKTISNLSSDILVAPNPANGNMVGVILQLTQVKPVILSITDLSGRILSVNKMPVAIRGKNTFSVNNIQLKPGVYIVLAEQDNKIIARTKFVVAE